MTARMTGRFPKGVWGEAPAAGERKVPRGQVIRATEGVDPANVSPSDLPDVPALKRERGGAIKDLELGECATDKGKQEVAGTITSSLEKKADYLVTVSWTTSSGDVMGRGFAVLKGVAPGASEDFTIEAKVAGGATQCVSGVVYGKA